MRSGPVALLDYQEEMRACAEAIGLADLQIVQPVDRWVELNGMRFHYLDWGNAELPPLVLLHGGGLTAHTWDMAALLLRERYHVIALDQRGHGDSGWTPERLSGAEEEEGMIEDTRQFMDQLGYTRLVLCGHSMGGANAIRYLARDADRVCALVLVDVGPTVQRQGPGAIEQFHRDTDSLARFEDYVQVATAFNADRRPEHIRYSLLHALKRSGDEWTWKHDRRPRPGDRSLDESGWGAWNDQRGSRMRADLAAIRVPTLLLRGEVSRSLSQASAADAVSCLSLGELAVIPRAGHSLQGDNPRDFAAAVDSFLDRWIARDEVAQ